MGGLAFLAQKSPKTAFRGIFAKKSQKTNFPGPRSRRPSSRGRAAKPRQQPADCPFGVVAEPLPDAESLPVIKLNDKQLSEAWQVKKQGEKFIVTGAKIEKFARRTDLNNYESVNRLRDILKKLGIRAELTNQGAEPDSVISIAGKEFTLVEDY